MKSLKFIGYIILTILLSQTTFAQSDNCSGAVTITPGATCTWTNGTSASATNQLGTAGYPAPGCAGSTYLEVWYKFVCPATGAVTIDSQTNGITDSGMALYSGTCGSLTLVECDDDDSPNGAMSLIQRTGLTPGATYYIAFWKYAGGTGTFKICVQTYTPPTPPTNDNCAGATVLTQAAYGTCTSTTGTVLAATNSGVANCTGTADDDVWYSFIATNTSAIVRRTTSGSWDSGVEVFNSNGASPGTCIGTSIGCQDAESDYQVNGLTIGRRYYVRMYTWGSGYTPGTPSFTICITSPPPPPTNDECTGAPLLTINTYGSCASTTAGYVTGASSSVVPIGSCFGTPDDDVWYRFTATSTAHNISLNSITGSTSDMYFAVYAGSCVSPGLPILCSDPESNTVSGLTIGQTYYVRVYTYTSTAGQTSAFNICVQSPPSCPANLGAGVVNVASLPYTIAGETLNAAAANDITSSNAISCGSSYYLDNYDKVYIFTPTSSGSSTITVNSATSYLGATLYEGCPFTGNCVGYVKNFSTGAKSFCVSLNSGTTYYLVVDAYNTNTNMTYSLSVTSPSGGASNDLPCNATTIFNGVSVSGDNTCTSGSGEPSTPSCWTSGSINSVWYKFQAISSSMYIQTTLTTIASTQIALYSGTCGALTLVACNQDAGSTGCNGTSTQNSILDITTLTSGNWYWVRLDGEYENVGTFNIILNDGTSSTTNDPLLGQDCMSPVPICSNVVNVANPSYAGTGNICDFTGVSDCTSGEKNSVWYTFEIGTSGNLNFNIKPNDATNSSYVTDYDWVLWKLTTSTGATNTTCATLDGAPPVSCNFNGIGVTGMSPTGNTPAPFTGAWDAAFEPQVAVVAGETYVLVVQNFSTSSSGFNLDFSTSSVGVIDATPSTIYWNGASNTSFTNVANYGLCSVPPACGINVVINNSGFQPTISGTTTYCRDLTINPGATLTFAANSTLYICGNFTNNGTIICPTSSTIVFVDGSNTTQTVSGNFTGTTNNRFGNLTVTKTSGSVILNNNVNIGGNFTTTNSTSVFNSNNKYIKVAGHFLNATGNTTFTNTGTAGTLEFNGTALQNYNQGSSQLDLNFVVLNNAAAIGSGVTLLTNMFVKATTGTLTLTLGTITTGGTSTTTGFKVHVLNTTPTSVSIGNTSSFIDGNLRRYVTTSGDYNWPVGNVAKGYQRARTLFSVTAGMTYIDSRFDVWPLTCTTNFAECGTTYDQPSENNGFWTMIPNAGTCTYNCTLYPLNATNTAGMSAWTIIKRPHTTAIDNTGWILNGTCVVSTATQVSRDNMTNFSFLGVDQALTPLPIELTSFDGYNKEGRNVINWTTAIERDNDFFIVEKSKNGEEFEYLMEVDGAGNSTDETSYEIIDNNPFNNLTYYRLKQTDFNGHYTYSKIIAISTKFEVLTISELYPNPTNNITSFDFFTPNKGEIQVRIFDNSGRLILNRIENLNNGSNTINLDLEKLAKGAYTFEVKFNNSEFVNTQKLIKN